MSKTILFSDLIAIGLGNYMSNPVINDMQNVGHCANSNDTHNFSKNSSYVDSDK
jgi:hypothetical protein